VINTVIYGTIFVFSYTWLTGTFGQIAGINQPGAGFLEGIFHIVLLIAGFLILLIVCYLAFTIFGGLVTAPFNEKISQHVEKMVSEQESNFQLGFWRDAYVSIKAEAQKLVFYFSILFVLLLLNLAPAIGSAIAFVLGILFSFYYNALDFLDYPMTRRQMKFVRKLKVTGKGGMLTYGFGCIAFLMMFLPVVNVFMKPILVAAGTSLYFERRYGAA
jgi:CysZ protein